LVLELEWPDQLQPQKLLLHIQFAIFMLFSGRLISKQVQP